MKAGGARTRRQPRRSAGARVKRRRLRGARIGVRPVDRRDARGTVSCGESARTKHTRKDVMIEGDIGYWTEHHSGKMRCHVEYRSHVGGNLMMEREILIGREGTAIMEGKIMTDEATVDDQEKEARAALRPTVNKEMARGNCKRT